MIARKKSPGATRPIGGLSIMNTHPFLQRRQSMRLLMALTAATMFFTTASQTLADDFVLETDLTYGSADGEDLKLDLARPATGDGPFPAIVYIHGGGWHAGNRSSFRPLAIEAAKRGYVAVSISYRLMKFDQANKETTTAKPIFPAQIHDAKAAVRWVRANANKYKIDADHIGVAGGSAGGHLSLLVGLTDADDKLEGESGNPDHSSSVQAVVNIFGPTEMASAHQHSSVAWIFRLFLGGEPNEAAKLYTAASPVTYIDANDPPILTFHGDQDKLVPIAQAKVLDEKLKAAGVDHTLMIFEGQGHGFSAKYNLQAMDAAWKFFDEHLKK